MTTDMQPFQVQDKWGIATEIQSVDAGGITGSRSRLAGRSRLVPGAMWSEEKMKWVSDYQHLKLFDTRDEAQAYIDARMADLYAAERD